MLTEASLCTDCHSGPSPGRAGSSAPQHLTAWPERIGKAAAELAGAACTGGCCCSTTPSAAGSRSRVRNRARLRQQVLPPSCSQGTCWRHSVMFALTLAHRTPTECCYLRTRQCCNQLAQPCCSGGPSLRAVSQSLVNMHHLLASLLPAGEPWRLLSKAAGCPQEAALTTPCSKPSRNRPPHQYLPSPAPLTQLHPQQHQEQHQQCSSRLPSK